MNYTLNQLRIFLKVVQTESITKASEILHLTQPAVSIQLKNFQDQFEIPLTEVIGRRLYITDFGREIADAAEKILEEVNTIASKTEAYKGKLTGKLKISVVSTGKYVMPYFLVDFLKQHTGIELLLDVTNKAKVIESIEKNEVDFSLVSVLPSNMKLDKIELMQNKLFVIAGLGYSIMPLIGIKNELNDGSLRIIPVKGFPIKSVWNLIWLKEKKLSPVAQAFLNYVRKEKSNIIKEKLDWFEKY